MKSIFNLKTAAALLLATSVVGFSSSVVAAASQNIYLTNRGMKIESGTKYVFTYQLVGANGQSLHAIGTQATFSASQGGDIMISANQAVAQVTGNVTITNPHINGSVTCGYTYFVGKSGQVPMTGWSTVCRKPLYAKVTSNGVSIYVNTSDAFKKASYVNPGQAKKPN